MGGEHCSLHGCVGMHVGVYSYVTYGGRTDGDEKLRSSKLLLTIAHTN